ncbi:tRNA (adenosine(37)-N6)-threonylcarbamoyltransferase complex ATPase subunit type 1 TsaE [Halalkalibacillus sediminis]|uniref:tRNA threonylcarbamoyladenosine biosynthesis protein TsaE n=1 Tax=Halalkalibacillus sediminis TaxID=2018042 RepID=A0A2I0QQD6_9BACI|nr:tRNA (adenosine(37)-N6)-threonylcarbamoyltransferase complex ATPase subunit type 1 TsaE [Halalkalibacillus sediminis]PKR76532.1 tRNA (adenosine(37)-N6)-threonylcarbamoyltransferase complex ATPase subunit type 1 TsaE [Halalkalibacillus sediminis]
MYKFTTESEEETRQLSESLGQLLIEGDVLTLDGDLGAGKTTFTKGLAKGLGVKRTVNSPTYTIIKEYRGDKKLFHMDVYRLEDSDEDIGFDEYFYGDGITVVEWSTFIKDFLPEERLEIRVEKVDEQSRVFHFEPKGNRMIRVCEELQG